MRVEPMFLGSHGAPETVSFFFCLFFYAHFFSFVIFFDVDDTTTWTYSARWPLCPLALSVAW